VLTSAAVGGGAPGHAEAQPRRGRRGGALPAIVRLRRTQARRAADFPRTQLRWKSLRRRRMSLGLRPVGPTPRREPLKRFHNPSTTWLWLFSANHTMLSFVGGRWETSDTRWINGYHSVAFLSGARKCWTQPPGLAGLRNLLSSIPKSVNHATDVIIRTHGHPRRLGLRHLRL
jgi:hypothetical protein